MFHVYLSVTICLQTLKSLVLAPLIVELLFNSVVRPKLICIMDSSSTILLCEITLSGSSIPILHLFSCRVALRSAVFTAARILPSVSRHLEIFFRPQGAFAPGFYLLRDGWVHCPAPEAPLTRGMPTGPRAFLANSWRVWATALRPVPPKKWPCAIHARKVGRASNTAVSQCCISSVVGSHFGRPCLLRHESSRVYLGTWRFPSASGGLPLRLLLPSGRLG